MNTTIVSTITHAITLTPDGEYFVMKNRAGEQTAISTITVRIAVDANGQVDRLATSFQGRGRKMRDDGTLTRASRVVTGHNLASLPDEAIDAILAATDGLGVTGFREDIAQLRAWRSKHEAALNES